MQPLLGAVVVCALRCARNPHVAPDVESTRGLQPLPASFSAHAVRGARHLQHLRCAQLLHAQNRHRSREHCGYARAPSSVHCAHNLAARLTRAAIAQASTFTTSLCSAESLCTRSCSSWPSCCTSSSKVKVRRIPARDRMASLVGPPFARPLTHAPRARSCCRGVRAGLWLRSAAWRARRYSPTLRTADAAHGREQWRCVQFGHRRPRRRVQPDAGLRALCGPRPPPLTHVRAQQVRFGAVLLSSDT